MPRSATAWIVVVLVAGGLSIAGVLAGVPGPPVDPLMAVTLGVGVALAIRWALRYRIGGSIHALTADEALLVAMLLVMPSGWPPLVLSLGVVLGNLTLRRPPIRIAFNFGMVGLSAATATATYLVLNPSRVAFTLRSLGAMTAAIVVYAVVSGLVIAVLFRRLGGTPIVDSVRDVLPVVRVTLPVNIVAGFGLGWLATHGTLYALGGVGVIALAFAGYRTAVGAQQQRDRAARLREVSRHLVVASSSLEAFDLALGRVASLFGAQSCELHMVGSSHRMVDVESGRQTGSNPTPAAIAALELANAVTYPPGRIGGPDGAMAAPLLVDDAPVGSLILHTRRGLEPWDDADEDVLDGIAGEILIALTNAELVEEIAGERSRLARQTELLGGVLKAASDGIALIAEDGTVQSWNPAMSGITGSSGSVIGRQWDEVLYAMDDSGGREAPRSSLATAMSGTPLSKTWRIRPAAGEERWVRVVLTPATAGDQRAVVLAAHDVTAAREVDRLKSDFIATVSHELRTPLTPIKGFIELDARGALDAARRPEMLELMRRQVTRLENLIEDLLSMSQLDRDLVDLASEPVELREALTRVHATFVSTGRVMPHSEPVRVTGDLDAIVRVLDALVDNALKHTDGVVEVTAGHRDGIGFVRVTDHGAGIAATDLERIFERFARLGDHLLRTQGPGLGLPIARALARRLGGDVTVTSEVDVGATFELSLPLA